MEKLQFIAKPKWWWLVGIPWGFLGAYNLYRQEINTKAPPIFDITDDVHWIVWFLIFLIVQLFSIKLGKIFRLLN